MRRRQQEESERGSEVGEQKELGEGRLKVLGFTKSAARRSLSCLLDSVRCGGGKP